jgi:hypothetical protein
MGGAGRDSGNGFVVAGDGGFIVVGTFSGMSSFGLESFVSVSNSSGDPSADIFVSRINGTTGDVLWTATAGGAGADGGLAIAEIADGYVITGFFSGTAAFGPSITLTSAGGTDIFVATVSRSGEFLGAARAGGAGDDAALAMATTGTAGGAGLLLAGRFQGSGASFGALTLAAAGNAENTDIFVARVTGAVHTAFQFEWEWAVAAGGPGVVAEVAAVQDFGGDSAVVVGKFKGDLKMELAHTGQSLSHSVTQSLPVANRPVSRQRTNTQRRQLTALNSRLPSRP